VKNSSACIKKVTHQKNIYYCNFSNKEQNYLIAYLRKTQKGKNVSATFTMILRNLWSRKKWIQSLLKK